MVLAIIAFALEVIFIAVVNGMTTSGVALSEGFAWFVIIVFIFSTVCSICTLVKNAKGMKNPVGKAKSVVGFVFSIVALVIGSIFLISCFATMLSI